MAATDHTSEHKHGSMEIQEHEKTFENFIRWVAWVSGLSILVLIFLGLANS